MNHRRSRTSAGLSRGAAAGLFALLASLPATIQANALKATAGATANANEGADVTFAGFHVFEDGTSRLYVQLTAAVPVDANVTGKKAEYLLHGARIPLRNNKNPLSTEHFVAQVVSARLVPVGPDGARGKKRARGHRGKPTDVRLVVEMREDAKPEHRLVRNADGTATLVVDFPKPVKPPTAPADPVAPKPKKSEAQ